MEVVVRRLTKIKSTYYISVPVEWGRLVERMGGWVIIRRQADNTLMVEPQNIYGEEGELDDYD